MWNSKGVDLKTSTDIWDDETGETVAEAYARFSTFGPLMNAAEALSFIVTNPGVDMMSFGYGDDPADFDSVEEDELRESIQEDGYDATDNVWGPFAPWVNSATTEPVDAVDVIEAALVEANPSRGLAQQAIADAVLKALTVAGFTVLAPQDIEWGACPETPGQPHRVSLSLCSGCMEYDPD